MSQSAANHPLRVSIRMKRAFLLLAVSLSFSVAAHAQAPSTHPAPTHPPRFVVNLLDYVASDYAGAVKGGQILSASEYAEQREFAHAAREAAREIPEAQARPEIDRGIAQLEQLIANRAEPSAVAHQAQEAKEAVIRATGLSTAPAAWPNLSRGRELFAANCVSCHGAQGRGDGPAAAALNPRPANLVGAEDGKPANSPPLHAFNVLRVGVPGTAMVAFDHFSDTDAWAVAFFVSSLRFQSDAAAAPTEAPLPTGVTLDQVARLDDPALLEILPGPAEKKPAALAALRLRSGGEATGDEAALALALGMVSRSDDDFRGGRRVQASDEALRAYLEGVEPAEPRLRAEDPAFTSHLEEVMLGLRSAIDGARSAPEVAEATRAAQGALAHAQSLLAGRESSPWLAFVISSGIVLREGFEAVLILIALMAALRGAERAPGAPSSRRAVLWVHAGWVAALACGVLAWIFSAWLLKISGAGREMLEGVVSCIAVVVLLYMGFWLHSRTEIHRWKAFVDDRVRSALAGGGGGLALAAISFAAVFREAFEVVLFLRALALGGGTGTGAAIALGVGGSLVVLVLASWALIQYSARIPIRRVFAWCSALMIVLAVILAGKGMHSFQEIGLVASNSTWGFGSLAPRLELVGVFSSVQTLVAQGAVLLVALALWLQGRRPPAGVRRRVPTETVMP